MSENEWPKYYRGTVSVLIRLDAPDARWKMIDSSDSENTWDSYKACSFGTPENLPEITRAEAVALLKGAGLDVEETRENEWPKYVLFDDFIYRFKKPVSESKSLFEDAFDTRDPYLGWNTVSVWRTYDEFIDDSHRPISAAEAAALIAQAKGEKPEPVKDRYSYEYLKPLIEEIAHAAGIHGEFCIHFGVDQIIDSIKRFKSDSETADQFITSIAEALSVENDSDEITVALSQMNRQIADLTAQRDELLTVLEEMLELNDAVEKSLREQQVYAHVGKLVSFEIIKNARAALAKAQGSAQ